MLIDRHVPFGQAPLRSFEQQVHGILAGGSWCNNVTIDMPHNVGELQRCAHHNLGKELLIHFRNQASFSQKRIGEWRNNSNDNRCIDPSKEGNLSQGEGSVMRNYFFRTADSISST